MINILYEDNHLLVVEKPTNIPVQADDSQDPDLLTLLKQYLVEEYNKPGDAYLGLVHRLDRPVGGVMVFAKTSKAAARLVKQFQEQSTIKIYTALCVGSLKPQILTDYLVKNRKTNTSYVTSKDNPKGKFSQLEIIESLQEGDVSRLTIQLHTGRSHQIRVQLSSRNHPLVGDQRYNKHARPGQQIHLWASELTLIHPTTKETLTFTSIPYF